MFPLVATEPDPVAHAESQHDTRERLLFSMDARVKPGMTKSSDGVR
jgi:hypothetical protein